jgi:hypothetical protein
MEAQGVVDTVGTAKQWLRTVTVGKGMHSNNLTIFPLYWKGEEEAVSSDSPPSWGDGDTGVGEKLRYRLLADAIEAKLATVEETSESGDVPLLAVRNDGATPILIPEGEILIGAKQNRTVNLTLLVAAKTQMQMPVSCVEAGRWSRTSRHFEAKAWAHPKLRELKVRSALMYRREMGEARSDQGAVWDEINEHLEDCDIPAPTRDLAMSFEEPVLHTSKYRERIELPESACGFLAAKGDEVIGLDLFDSAETLQKLWRRMSDAYFVEAARDDGRCEKTPSKVASDFLSSVEDRLVPAAKQPQLGFEMELVDEALSGSALWYDGAICHLSAFSTNN